MSDSTVEVHDGAGVLIVEDEALVALFLEDTLDTLGYRCCGVADNAEEAVSLAQARRPALALVDVGLRGDRDGIALAADLTELGIAVVFLTGASDLETRSEEHTSELQSLTRISYAVFCLKKKKHKHQTQKT